MKYIIFVWVPIILCAMFFLVPIFSDYTVPFDGIIFLIGASISSYTGLKSFLVYKNAKELPSGEGLSPETNKKMTHILIGIYVIIFEAIIVQYINPELKYPLDELFIMAGICTATVLGGVQAMKGGKSLNGSK